VKRWMRTGWRYVCFACGLRCDKYATCAARMHVGTVSCFAQGASGCSTKTCVPSERATAPLPPRLSALPAAGAKMNLFNNKHAAKADKLSEK
jgi:hypothetical protein